MCLFFNWNNGIVPEPLIAQEDMICYKVGENHKLGENNAWKQFLYDVFVSYFMYYEYTPGQLNPVINLICKKEEKVKSDWKDICDNTSLIFYNEWSIERGYFSYVDLETARQEIYTYMDHYPIGKFIIPKGSSYFMQKNAIGQMCYVSSQIIFELFIEK